MDRREFIASSGAAFLVGLSGHVANPVFPWWAVFCEYLGKYGYPVSLAPWATFCKERGVDGVSQAAMRGVVILPQSSQAIARGVATPVAAYKISNGLIPSCVAVTVDGDSLARVTIYAGDVDEIERVCLANGMLVGRSLFIDEIAVNMWH